MPSSVRGDDRAASRHRKRPGKLIDAWSGGVAAGEVMPLASLAAMLLNLFACGVLAWGVSGCGSSLPSSDAAADGGSDGVDGDDGNDDDGGGGDAGADASDGGSDDAAADGLSDDGATDGPLDIELRCTDRQLTANDKTAIPGQVELFSTVSPPGPPTPAAWHPPQYRQPCITISAGQSLDFSGDFAIFPLEPSGGDTPNPIPLTVANPPAVAGVRVLHVVFPTPGIYGFDCPLYPLDMFGAVRVVP